jgi:DNA-binding NtrC family response regulator
MTWPVIAGSAPPVGVGTGRNASLPKEAKRGAGDAARDRSVRVLIVDDEPSICKALGMALGHAGYEILTARSGEAAFAVIDTQRVDILLIDLRIPDMRGDAIFEYAAGVQTHLREHTLFITGDISDQAVELIGLCRCNYVRKPFDLTVMLDAVAALSPLEQAQKSSA